MNNCFNKVYSSFNPLHSKLLPGNRIINTFSDYFSFHPFNECKNNLKERIQKLDNLAIKSLGASTQALVITDASVKNNVATSITHIHIHDKPIIKMLHYTMNVMSTEAELFIMRCDINQAINTNNILRIIVITDFLYIAKKIFDPLLHPYQSHSNFILKELCNFFTQSQENTIEFWECPSCSKWYLHNTVDKDTKSFSPILLLLCKQL